MNDIIELCDELACNFAYSHRQDRLPWAQTLYRHVWRIEGVREGESNDGRSESLADCLQGCKKWLLQIKSKRLA
jgi:hypothetical protein